MKQTLLFFALLILLTVPTRAEVIQPVAVISEEYVYNSADHTIDNSGMSNPVVGGETPGSALDATHVFHGGYSVSYASTAPGGTGSDFFASIGSDAAAELVYDLTGGGDTTFSGVIFWQYENSGGGAARAGNLTRTIEIRTNTESEGAALFVGPFQTVTLLPVTDGDTDATNDMGGRNSAQGFALGETSGRYVHIAITDNYFGIQGMTAGGDRVGLGEIRFATEPIPPRVLDKAWLMVVHAHPDDEAIFFGGTLPYYSQVLGLPTVLVDMTTGFLNDDCTQTANSDTREAEHREVAWRYGLPTIPVYPFFQDTWTGIPADIARNWDRWADCVEDGDDVAEGQERASRYLAEQIRRYRPEVIATHDFGGEYGHGDHRATAHSTAAAWDLAADRDTVIDDGANPPHTITPLGVVGDPWEAKKVYIHFYDQNRLFHDHWEEVTIDGDDDGLPDQTPREVANHAMDAYVSQGQPKVATVYDPLANGGNSWDDYPSEWWGLHASTVGPDSVAGDFTIEGQLYSGWARGDFMEHIPMPPPTVTTGISCVPGAGTVPFPMLMTVTLSNNEEGLTRRIAARLDVTLAGGQSFSSWRAGYANVAPGNQFQTGWVTTIPALGSVIGDNLFRLQAEDVTPFPWNQPPYPPTGDMNSSLCTVEGRAP